MEHIGLFFKHRGWKSYGTIHQRMVRWVHHLPFSNPEEADTVLFDDLAAGAMISIDLQRGFNCMLGVLRRWKLEINSEWEKAIVSKKAEK
jgi:hypothetical protein